MVLQAAEMIWGERDRDVYIRPQGRHLLVRRTALAVLSRSSSPLILLRAESLPGDEPAPTGLSDSG